MNPVSQFYCQREKLRIAVRQLAHATEALTLDIGCGRGELSYELAKGQRRLIALDYEYHPDWRQNPQLNFMQANALQLPFRDNTFDVIVASECLQYIADVKSALAEFRRVLKPAGKLVVSFPNGDAYLHFVDPYNVIHFFQKITRGAAPVFKVGYRDFVLYPSVTALLNECPGHWNVEKNCRRGSLLFIYFAFVIDILYALQHKIAPQSPFIVAKTILNRVITLFFRLMQLDFSLKLGAFSYNCILLLRKTDPLCRSNYP